MTVFVRNSVSTALIEELPDETDDMTDNFHSFPIVSKRKRLDIETREQHLERCLNTIFPKGKKIGELLIGNHIQVSVKSLTWQGT